MKFIINRLKFRSRFLRQSLAATSTYFIVRGTKDSSF